MVLHLFFKYPLSLNTELDSARLDGQQAPEPSRPCPLRTRVTGRGDLALQVSAGAVNSDPHVYTASTPSSVQVCFSYQRSLQSPGKGVSSRGLLDRVALELVCSQYPHGGTDA